MNSNYQILFAIGSILVLGLAADFPGRCTFLPRVTVLLIIGILIGEEVFNLIPSVVFNSFELITDIALLMVGFLLGGKLTRESLQGSGKKILWISICAAIGSTIVVSFVFILIGVPLEIAILLGCVASVSYPAAAVDVVSESNNENPFTK